MRAFTISSDGNGGFDVCEGDFTIASVRDTRAEDGAKAFGAYRQAFDYTPRETALLFKAAPAMLAALQQIESDWGEAMRDDSPINGGDAVQWLCEFFPQVTAAIALATGAPTGEAAGEDCQTCADACETRLLPCDECGALDSTPTDEKPARTFTAFCQQANGRGTIWIQAVEAETLEDAIHTAINDCADAWGYDAAAVHCLGLIEGEATVAHWQDLEG